MKFYLVTLLTCFCVNVFAATLYKVVNKDGTVTYTDQPVEGAVPVDLGKVNSATMPALAKPKKTLQINSKAKDKKNIEYQLSFSSPVDGQTIRDNLGRVNVSAALSPSGPGIYELFVDGVSVGTSPNPNFTLEGINRGEHSLQMRFKHNSGKILASTSSIVFYLHKASALIKAN